MCIKPTKNMPYIIHLQAKLEIKEYASNQDEDLSNIWFLGRFIIKKKRLLEVTSTSGFGILQEILGQKPQSKLYI